MLENIELKNIATIFSSFGFLRISFSLCSGIRMLPRLISIARLIDPLILLLKKLFKVFSISSESINKSQSSLSTALTKPALPSCIKSLILNTPEACCDVANFLAKFSTKGMNFIINSSLV